MDCILVLGTREEAIGSNFALPLWQEQPDRVKILAQPGDENYHDGIDGYDDPAAGGQKFRITVAPEAHLQAVRLFSR